MADYPDWVMAHKKKGTYINYVDGRYYLYAAHSERIQGTKKVRRVSDGYIGRITEEDGLIPARDKVVGDVFVYEYGLSAAVIWLCGNIHKGLSREFRGAADRVFVMGALLALYGSHDMETYDSSYLSIEYPGLDMEKPPTIKQATAIERCRRMVMDVMGKLFGEGLGAASLRLARVYKIKINGRFYMSHISENIKQWLGGCGIEWRDMFGKDK
jgi:hypothetical protein